MNKIILGALVLATAISSNTVDAGACQKGLRKAERVVKRMWRNLDEDCAEIMGFEWKVNRMVSREFRKTRSDSGDNWMPKKMKRCFKIGAAEMLEKYEKECLEDDPALCDALAEAAAERIVFKNVCIPESARNRDKRAMSYPDYKKSCRNYAVDSCPGLIKPKVKQYCRGKDRNVKRNQLRELQELCEDAVDNML